MRFGDNYLTNLFFDIANQRDIISAIDESADKEETKWSNLKSREANEDVIFAQKEVFRASHAKRSHAKAILGELEEELTFPEAIDYHQ